MDKAYEILEKSVRRELSERFPNTSFKLSTFKPKLAGSPHRGQYKVRGKVIYVEFFVEHLAEKNITEDQVRTLIEEVLNSPENDTDVSKVVFKRKTVPVKVSTNRLASLRNDVREMIDKDEDNRETVLQTLETLAKSLSRNDSAMVMNVLSDYDKN